jgi:ATP-dependent RNA helicase RhlE
LLKPSPDRIAEILWIRWKRDARCADVTFKKPIQSLERPDVRFQIIHSIQGHHLKNFQKLNLIAEVQRALAEENYHTPTPIQAQTIPPALAGRDVLGCAQTGTGKTAAFALPMLTQLGQNDRKAIPHQPFALVLAPTRELAIQIGESFNTYGRYLDLRTALVYGGVSQMHQVKALKRGAHILVATPGRLLDLINQGHVKLDRLELFALDEADRMLDMGFLPDLKRIISRLPEKRQSLFFSATIPPKIAELTRQLLRNPVSVNVTPKITSVEKIEQRVLFVQPQDKLTLLEGILSGGEVDRALVFTRTKRAANKLSKQLLRGGINAAAIHGNKSQNARQQALEAFRRRKVRVLVATDVAARGIDIDGITHVVNFDLPVEPEAYVHRIGRTGRAGADGIALSFCTTGERRELNAIQRLIGQNVPADPDFPFPDSGRRNPKRNSPQRKRKTSGRTNSGDKSASRTSASEGTRSNTPAPPKRRRRRRSKTRQTAGKVC